MQPVASHCLWHAEHMFSVQQQQAEQAQCRTTEAYLQLLQHGHREKAPYITFISDLVRSCSCTREGLWCYRNVKYPLIILIIYCSICYILFSDKLNLYWCSSYPELFHLLYRLFRSCIIYIKCVLFKLLIIENARGFYFLLFVFTFIVYIII